MSTTQITPQADRMIRAAAHNLIHLAAFHGLLPTLETQPRQPLAMGNHGLRLTLRPVRNPDPAAADNCRRPDLLEKLTYHEGARHDMSLEDCLSFLADGWKETPGRSYTQLVLQLTELLAAAPSKPYCWSDCTAYTAGIEGQLQALRKKVATYEARDALGRMPPPAGELGPDGKEWAKTAAGYAHVEAMLPRADGQGSSPFWYGWALRGAFVAGAEWQESRATQEDKPRAVSDTIRLDVMHANRVAVIPEYEGPWDAEVYGEDEAIVIRVSGNTPRAALDAAIEALSELEANNARLR